MDLKLQRPHYLRVFDSRPQLLVKGLLGIFRRRRGVDERAALGVYLPIFLDLTLILIALTCRVMLDLGLSVDMMLLCSRKEPLLKLRDFETESRS